MKYIRTKDGIVNVSNMQEYEADDENNNRIFDGYGLDDGSIYYPTEDIIKQADTIEELIDEYVLVEKSARCFLNYDEITEDDLKLCLQDHDIFGAIWTDKGLIYVAKMNEKGELELL